MRRLPWITLAALFLSGGLALAAGHHVWTPVPHQRGVLVDLNSIKHGRFLTGGASSPMADTRALVDVFGQIETLTLGCSCCGAPPNLLLVSRDFDEGRLTDFICHHPKL